MGAGHDAVCLWGPVDARYEFVVLKCKILQVYMRVDCVEIKLNGPRSTRKHQKAPGNGRKHQTISKRDICIHLEGYAPKPSLVRHGHRLRLRLSLARLPGLPFVSLLVSTAAVPVEGVRGDWRSHQLVTFHRHKCVFFRHNSISRIL